MEVPQEILEKYGTNGVVLYKKAHGTGRLEGAKVAKSPFATEMNSVANSIIKSGEKEGYKAPTAEEVGTLCTTTFRFGNAVPDRSALKRIAVKALECIASMKLPEKAKKESSSSSESK